MPRAWSSARWWSRESAPKHGSTDDLIVFVLHRMDMKEFLPIATQIARLVNEHTGLEVAHVVPVKRIPKTTSGKIQRHLLEEDYVDGEYAAELAELATLRAQQSARGRLAATSSDIERKHQGHLRRRAGAQHRRPRQPVRDRRQLAEAHRDPRADRSALSGTGRPDRAVRLPDDRRPVAASRRQAGNASLISCPERAARRSARRWWPGCRTRPAPSRRRVTQRGPTTAPRRPAARSAPGRRRRNDEDEHDVTSVVEGAAQATREVTSEKPDKSEFIVWFCLTVFSRLPAPWISCRPCVFSPGLPSSAHSPGRPAPWTCRGPWPAATWPSSKNTSAPACSTAPPARSRCRRRARSTSSIAGASWRRSRRRMTSCGWRATGPRAGCGSTCRSPSASTCCCRRFRSSRSVIPRSRSKCASTIATSTCRPKAWTWRCAWATCVPRSSSPSASRPRGR